MEKFDTLPTPTGTYVVPENGMTVTEDTQFAPGTYLLPDGITIGADNITLHAEGVCIIGENMRGTGVRIEGKKGVCIFGLQLMNYYHCIVATDAEALLLSGIRACATAEEPPDTLFLDIWRTYENSYGGAVVMNKVQGATVEKCQFDHSMCGLLSYDCSALNVHNNTAHYCSAYGFHLYGTTDSTFERNGADYCCRFNVRDDAPAVPTGHMGADATGFLILAGSHRNVFRHNRARLGGDGFFLAGSSPDVYYIGADDNLFEENDASWSPNIAFEATFSRGNIFRNNIANHCNYGFWLGYSYDTVIEGNTILNSRQGGIATENGWNTVVRGNTFKKNTHGILLWSRLFKKDILDVMPAADTSHDWEIYDNTFERNMKGIRIAARQNHGILPLAEELHVAEENRPHSHVIKDNTFRENCYNIELDNCDATTIENNAEENTIGASLRETNCT